MLLEHAVAARQPCLAEKANLDPMMHGRLFPRLVLELNALIIVLYGTTPAASSPDNALYVFAEHLWQHFKNNGYLTVHTGKLFHTEEGGAGNLNTMMNGPGMPPNSDPPSWSPGLLMPQVNAVAQMYPTTPDEVKTHHACAAACCATRKNVIHFLSL